MVSFKHDRVVDAVWFEQGSPNAAYSVSQRVTVLSFSGGDKLHPVMAEHHCSQSADRTLPGVHGLCN